MVTKLTSAWSQDSAAFTRAPALRPAVSFNHVAPSTGVYVHSCSCLGCPYPVACFHGLNKFRHYFWCRSRFLLGVCFRENRRIGLYSRDSRINAISLTKSPVKLLDTRQQYNICRKVAPITTKQKTVKEGPPTAGNSGHHGCLCLSRS